MKAYKIFSQWLLSILATIIFLAGIFTNQLSAKDVSGEQSGKWTLANSPYIVQGDITVQKDQSLTIEPGVVVKFAGFYRMTVRGTLIAKGNEATRIIFTSDKDFEFGETGSLDSRHLTPQADDWNVIEFIDDSGQQPSTISHCLIRYSANIIQCDNAAPVLSKIIITDCKNSQLYINGSFKSINQGRDNDILISKSSVSKKTFSTPQSSSQFDDLLKGEEFTIGELKVITASKKAEKISDAPGVIAVITAQEIQSFGAINLMDVLQRAPSLQPITSHMLRKNVTAIRGDLLSHFDQHVLILMNGRTLRDGISGGLNNSIYTTFPIDLIERIEIVRGPGSVLYGTNAYAGVINIITKQAPETSSYSISVRGGSFGAINGSFTANLTKDKLNFLFGAQIFNDNGWNFQAMTRHPSPAIPDSLADVQYGQKKIGFGVHLKFKGLSFSGLYTYFIDDVLGSLPYVSSYSKDIFKRLFLNLSYQHKISNTWEADINLTNIHLKTRFNEDSPNSVLMGDTGIDFLGEFTVRGRIVEDLNVVFGGVIDARHNRVTESSMIPSYHFYNYSAYAQADYRPLSNLKLIFGTQINKPDDGNADVVPRFGAIYNFNNEVGVKALYGQAFRSATPGEKLIEVPGVMYGNPDLVPEKIATTDFQVFYAGNKAELAVTYFRSHYFDLIARLPNEGGGLVYMNHGEMDVEGVEFETKASVLPRLFLVGSASYQDNKDNKTYAPHTMVKFGASYKTEFGLSIGIFNTFFGKSLENDGAKLNPDPESVNLLSANIIYNLPTKMPIKLNTYANNLLDKDHHFTEFDFGLVNTLPIAAGRTIYGGLSVNF